LTPLRTRAGGVELVACCDRDRQRAEAFALRHGFATAYDDKFVYIAVGEA